MSILSKKLVKLTKISIYHKLKFNITNFESTIRKFENTKIKINLKCKDEFKYTRVLP
jgi:hypothetical protein